MLQRMLIQALLAAIVIGGLAMAFGGGSLEGVGGGTVYYGGGGFDKGDHDDD